MPQRASVGDDRAHRGAGWGHAVQAGDDEAAVGEVGCAVEQGDAGEAFDQPVAVIDVPELFEQDVAARRRGDAGGEAWLGGVAVGGQAAEAGDGLHVVTVDQAFLDDDVARQGDDAGAAHGGAAQQDELGRGGRCLLVIVFPDGAGGPGGDRALDHRQAAAVGAAIVVLGEQAAAVDGGAGAEQPVGHARQQRESGGSARRGLMG
jgi:hypothetical protein